MSKMPAETLKALRGSIAKWQAIVSGTGEDNGPHNCPLCKRFLINETGHRNGNDCDGCPVMERSGLRFCNGTPYDNYEDEDACGCGDREMLASLAQAELDFLISLLPEGEAP